MANPLILPTFAAAAGVLVLPFVGFYLLTRAFPARRAAVLVVTVAAAVGTAIVAAVVLGRAWEARNDRARQLLAARAEHMRRLQQLLGKESTALRDIAQGLRDGRYFTRVANDARRAIWPDEELTADVERHFPSYFQQREQLIRSVLDYDDHFGRVQAAVSASLRLPESIEPFRADLTRALMSKCGGGGSAMVLARSGGIVVRAYDEYQCAPALAADNQNLLDRAEDLAAAALAVSDAARHQAEVMTLPGSCPYLAAE